jgi:hypothetical protein
MSVIDRDDHGLRWKATQRVIPSRFEICLQANRRVGTPQCAEMTIRGLSVEAVVHEDRNASALKHFSDEQGNTAQS